MPQRSEPKVERPRSEPEIIPPSDPRIRSGWRSASFGQSQRIYVTRLGPFGAAMLALGIAAISASVLFLLIGAFLIVLPFAGVFLAAAIIIGLLTGSFRRAR
jgi:hypothetical protein